MIVDLFYCAMVSFLFVHELDAVKRHEWRVLPLTRFLPERVGETVFIWAHLPLFAIIIWLAGGPNTAAGPLAVSAFAVVHVGLHWIFRHHPANEFNNAGSWTLILGAGLFGILHIVAVMAR